MRKGVTLCIFQNVFLPIQKANDDDGSIGACHTMQSTGHYSECGQLDKCMDMFVSSKVLVQPDTHKGDKAVTFSHYTPLSI